MNSPDFAALVLDYFLEFRRECSIDQLHDHSGLPLGKLRELSWSRNDNVNRSKLGNCWYYSPAAHYVVEQLRSARKCA